MLEDIKSQFRQNIELHKDLIDKITPQIAQAAKIIIQAYKRGNKLLFCGNGGSAAEQNWFGGLKKREKDCLLLP